MPKIVEYTAPERGLEPSERGAQALEQAGRTIRLTYRDIGTFEKEKGAAGVEQLKDSLWPLTIAKLFEGDAGSLRSANPRPSGISIKSVNPDDNARGRSIGGGGNYADHNQVSNGMGALGDFASGIDADRNGNPTYRVQDSQGNRLVTDRNGNPVYSYNNPKAVADAYNARQQENASINADAYRTADYWARYYGGEGVPTDQSGPIRDTANPLGVAYGGGSDSGTVDQTQDSGGVWGAIREAVGTAPAATSDVISSVDVGM